MSVLYFIYTAMLYKLRESAEISAAWYRNLNAAFCYSENLCFWNNSLYFNAFIF